MDVEIKSITPIATQVGPYEFEVKLEVDGKPVGGFKIKDARELLDFHEFRVSVANLTGYRLDPKLGEDWESQLEKWWRKPEPWSQSPDESAGDEEERMPDELREIDEASRKTDEDYRRGRDEWDD